MFLCAHARYHNSLSKHLVSLRKEFIVFKLNKYIFILVISLIGCSKVTLEQHIKNAEEFISLGKFDESIIELKNAIKLSPEHTSSRILLAKIYLNLGDLTFAQKEISKAIQLGGRQEITDTILARVLYLQQEFDEVLELISNAKSDSEVNFYRGQSLIATDMHKQGLELLASISKSDSSNKFSQLSGAYFKYYSKDIEGATLDVQKIVDKHTSFSDGYFLLAFLEGKKKNHEASILAYRKFNDILPRYVLGKIFLTDVLIKDKQHDAAEIEANLLLSINPSHPLFNQYKAIVRLASNDFQTSKLHIEQSIQNGFDSTVNRLIAGYSNFALKNYDQALQHFKLVSDELPDDHPARRIIAFTELTLGYTEKAQITLNGLTGLDESDAEIMTYASFEMMKSGDLVSSLNLLNKASKSAENNADLMFKQGILSLRLEGERGLEQLENAIELDTKIYNAEETLAYMYLKNNKLDKAMLLAEAWQKKYPKETKGFNLEASIHQYNKNFEAADLASQKSLKIDSSDTSSLFYFANRLDNNGDFKGALKNLEIILSKDTLYLPAASLYLVIAKNNELTADALATLDELVHHHQDNPLIKVLYASALFIENDYKKVITLLDQKTLADINNSQYWKLLGKSYFKSGDYEGALKVYKKWIKNQPLNFNAQAELVGFYHLTGAYEEALETARKAYENNKENDRIKLMYAYYLINLQKFNKAQRVLASLSKTYKTVPLAKTLNGQILARLGQFDKAIPLLREYYDINPQSNSTGYLFTSLIRSGLVQEAIVFAEKHFSKYPSDVLLRQIYADYLLTHSPSLAKVQYEKLLILNPQNYVAYNNYANILLTENKLKEANEQIVKGLEIKPSSPSLLDTAGNIQIALGNKKKAIEYLEKAKKITPNNADVLKSYKEALEIN